jgi:geranylgeranyl pyrophosphate synthase
MIDLDEAVHRIKKEHLSLPILYALQKPEIRITFSPLLLKKKITKKDAENILAIVDKAGGFDRTEEFMQKLAQDANSQVGRVTKNSKYLKLLTRRMILPEWRDFLNTNST